VTGPDRPLRLCFFVWVRLGCTREAVDLTRELEGMAYRDFSTSILSSSVFCILVLLERRINLTYNDPQSGLRYPPPSSHIHHYPPIHPIHPQSTYEAYNS
jgi:hypothetical protein